MGVCVGVGVSVGGRRKSESVWVWAGGISDVEGGIFFPIFAFSLQRCNETQD